MIWMTTIAMAGAVPAAGGVEVALTGSEDCDAAARLETAMVATVEVLPERMGQAAMCDRTGLYRGSVIDLYNRVAEAVVHHNDDPDALLELWSGASTLRFGLLGDAIRLAMATDVWGALEANPDGSWLEDAQMLMAREPGPQPGQDSDAFQEILVRDGLSMQAIPYLAMMPVYRWSSSSAQAALTAPDPRQALDAQEAAWWTVGSANGIARVTADLHEDHVDLQGRVATRSDSQHR